MTLYRINSGPMYQREQPVRDPRYTRYVKQFPCVGCRRTWRVDPCHVGPHALGQKASDLTVIPLCRACHQKFDANPEEFAVAHHLDIPALQRMFRRFYRLQHGTPDYWPNQPTLVVVACACGFEEFADEIQARGKCAQCGRAYQEAA